MKITSPRLAVLALAVISSLFIGSNQASAQTLRIQIGTPPPPLVVEHPWAAPYRGAVWIAGHHEWINGHWVWVAGYYTYPPRHGGHWVRAHYRDGYYYPGHWAY